MLEESEKKEQKKKGMIVMADIKETHGKETPEDRFLRLANARMNKVLKSMEVLGNLKAPSYKHDKRIERMLAMRKALLDAVNDAIPENYGVGADTEEKDGKTKFHLS